MPPFPSPFPPTSSKPGHGSVVLSLLPPAIPTFTTLSYTYPLKLLPSTPHTIPRLQPTPPSQQPINHTTKTDDAEAYHGISGTTTIREGNASSLPHTNNTAATTPSPSQSSLLFLLTYGGGLLAGDAIHLTLTLHPGTRLVVTTQGMGKIFAPVAPPAARSLSPSASAVASAQHITASLSAHSSLWLAPDCTQPFQGSRYISQQIFEVERTASLGVVEWVNQGRKARGEEWGARGWRSRVDVFEMTAGGGKRLVVRDNIVLENNQRGNGVGEQGEVKNRMDGYGVVGTLILMGPVFASLAKFFVGEFEGLERIGGRDWGGSGGRDDDRGGKAGGKEEEERRRRERWRADRQSMEKEQGVVWTACHVRGGKCCVVKFMAREMQGARDWLGGMLREEGTVGREFGEGGLMFVR